MIKTLSGVGPYDNNVYVVSSDGEALIVDASATPDEVRALIGSDRVVGLLITHGHGDHTVHLRALREAFGCPVYWGFDGTRDATLMRDGGVLRVGAIQVSVMHTPGHTPESACLLVGSDLITGDTLFPGGPGNTQNDPVKFAQIMDSVDRLFELPDETRVLPGHGSPTTLGVERPHVEEWRARGW
jgi:glyoxylase-like metal-dependent hydrolase (beta-lactamase superfamily II)